MQISIGDMRRLEVVLDSLRRSIDSGIPGTDPEDLSQLQAVADTLEVQFRAPRPSRRVLRWVVTQISAFPGGVLSGVAATYLPELVHHLI